MIVVDIGKEDANMLINANATRIDASYMEDETMMMNDTRKDARRYCDNNLEVRTEFDNNFKDRTVVDARNGGDIMLMDTYAKRYNTGDTDED